LGFSLFDAQSSCAKEIIFAAMMLNENETMHWWLGYSRSYQ
jgi:hypothetical protein